MSKKKYYGVCALCGYVGSIEKHHIIPKRFGIVTDHKPSLFHKQGESCVSIQLGKDVRVENIMMNVCRKCHKILHPENWKYHMNDVAIRTKEE